MPSDTDTSDGDSGDLKKGTKILTATIIGFGSIVGIIGLIGLIAHAAGGGSSTTTTTTGVLGNSDKVLPLILDEDREELLLAFASPPKIESSSFRSECHLSPRETCPISSMPYGKFSLVVPGGKTGCIDITRPYTFQVMRGDPKKLMIYFQGGGACWDKSSTIDVVPDAILPLPRGFCTQTIYEQTEEGVFDSTRADNVYRDYTIVHVNYCSGDAHVGDVVRDYSVRDPMWVGTKHKVEQKGYWNTMSAVNWILDQGMESLDSFVIMGCSAGNLGVQIWADKLLNTFRWWKADVISDSYAGIFPDGVQTRVIKGFGACKHGLIGGTQGRLCASASASGDDVNLPAIYKQAMSNHVKAEFGFVNSKIDAVQRSFFSFIAVSFHKQAIIRKSTYLKKVWKLCEDYAQYPNWIGYIVDGATHCFTCAAAGGIHGGGCNKGDYFEADATGLAADGKNSEHTLAQWLRSIEESGPSRPPVTPPHLECSGKEYPRTDWDKPWPFFDHDDFCDADCRAFLSR